MRQRVLSALGHGAMVCHLPGPHRCLALGIWRSAAILLALVAGCLARTGEAHSEGLPFGVNLELNVKVYRVRVEEQKAHADSISELRAGLLELVKTQKKPVTEAYIQFLYGKSLSQLGNRNPEALKCFENALEALSALTDEKSEGGLKPGSIYLDALAEVLKLRRSPEEKYEMPFELWVSAYMTSSKYSRSPFHRRGLELVKYHQANRLLEKQEFANAKRLYEDLLVGFPRSKYSSDIKDRLWSIAEKMSTRKFERFQNSQRSALLACVLTALCLAGLVAILHKRTGLSLWRKKQDVLDTRSGELKERILQSQDVSAAADDSAIFSPRDWHYNDPLAYLVERRNPSYLKMFLIAGFLMMGLHFLAALLDNNLYWEQNGWQFVPDLLAGNLKKMARTFLTLPRGYEPPQMEYFFNDYYGMIINGIVNPLAFVTVFRIYRRFGSIWGTLLKERTIQLEPADREASAEELSRFLVRAP